MSLNLVKQQRLDTGKIYLYLKDPLESSYQLLINWREKIDIKKLQNPNSQAIDVYKNSEEKEKQSIVFDGMIAGMEAKSLSSLYCF